jgi:hypothetical protein
LAAVTWLFACVGDTPNTSDPGKEGQPCFANGTCVSGLSCLSNTCVRTDGSAPGDGATTDGPSQDASPDVPADVAPDVPKLGCDGGACKPYLISNDFTAGTTIVATGDDVLFGAGGTVAKCPKTGCKGTPTILATFPANAQVATDGTTAFIVPYVQTGSGLFACALGGCNGTPVTLVGSQSYGSQPVLDGTSIFWSAANGTELWAGTLPSCTDASSIAPTVSGGSVRAVDATSVYWTQQSTMVRACDKANCAGTAVSLLTGLAEPSSVVVVGSTLYVATFGNGPGTGSVLRCTRTGSTCTGTTVLAGNLAYPNRIVVDGARAYVMEVGSPSKGFADARISYVPTSGGAAVPVVENTGSLKDLTQDGSNLFYITATGQVWGVAKP